jgi:hypothetical protein
MKFSAAAEGNFSEVLTQFENDCVQYIFGPARRETPRETSQLA